MHIQIFVNRNSALNTDYRSSFRADATISSCLQSITANWLLKLQGNSVFFLIGCFLRCIAGFFFIFFIVVRERRRRPGTSDPWEKPWEIDFYLCAQHFFTIMAHAEHNEKIIFLFCASWKAIWWYGTVCDSTSGVLQSTWFTFLGVRKQTRHAYLDSVAEKREWKDVLATWKAKR